jgi:hypothetical protein
MCADFPFSIGGDLCESQGRRDNRALVSRLGRLLVSRTSKGVSLRTDHWYSTAEA